MMYKLLAQIENVFDGISIPRQPLGESNIQNAIGLFFILAGVIAVIMVFIGGFQYVISLGDPQKTKKAKDTILYAVIGLVVSIMGSVIVNFVLDRL
ncbi:hypothetical protein BH23PAT2_BH23PAT2_06030 [soil metagenome]